MAQGLLQTVLQTSNICLHLCGRIICLHSWCHALPFRFGQWDERCLRCSPCLTHNTRLSLECTPADFQLPVSVYLCLRAFSEAKRLLCPHTGQKCWGIKCLCQEQPSTSDWQVWICKYTCSLIPGEDDRTHDSKDNRTCDLSCLHRLPHGLNWSCPQW